MTHLPVPNRREPLRFLVFSASLRHGSLNTRLAELAARAIVASGGQVDSASMSDFVAPSFNADSQRKHGFPAGAEEFPAAPRGV